jgi:hypothetical protein
MAVPDEARVGGGNPAETAELVEGSGHELIFWTGAAGEGAIVRPGTECSGGPRNLIMGIQNKK